MTVWVSGNIITSAWMNEVEKVLALGTYGSTSSPRLTESPNSTFDIASNHAAMNRRLNGSIAIGATQYYSWMDARTLTSTISSGVNTPYAAVLSWDHQYTGVAGSGGYGLIGTVTGVSGAGKASCIYGRVDVASAAFTGTAVAGTFATTLGATPDGSSCILNLESDATGAYQIPVGILINSNTTGVGSVGACIVVDSTVTVGSSVLAWNQLAGSTGSFLNLFDSSAVTLFNVDYLGNLNFRASGTAATTGQRITGDMTNATLAKRLIFQTATADSSSVVSVMPSGVGTVSQFTAFNGSDPDNAGRLSLQANGAAHIINSQKSGTGTVLSLGLQINGSSKIYLKSTGDVYLGQGGAAAADTTGHIYIQAYAGTPTGVPAGAVGYVPIRYDSTNDFLYVYNGGWKKSTVYA